MKTYLINTFNYNSWANTNLLETILMLPDSTEAIGLFSHLINAQDKWLNRSTHEIDDSSLAWFGHVYSGEELKDRWDASINRWLTFLDSHVDDELQQSITFIRPADGKRLAVKVVDIALQLNYHSIHHRAQINKLISAQGLPVPTTDYIFTVLKEA